MKAVSEFLGHHSPDFTEDIYVYQEGTAFDCSILSEAWDDIRDVYKRQTVIISKKVGKLPTFA